MVLVCLGWLQGPFLVLAPCVTVLVFAATGVFDGSVVALRVVTSSCFVESRDEVPPLRFVASEEALL